MGILMKWFGSFSEFSYMRVAGESIDASHGLNDAPLVGEEARNRAFDISFRAKMAEIKSKINSIRTLLRTVIKKYVLTDFWVTRKHYFYHNGFYPDLIEPKDLSEKISWLKLHDRSPLHTRCADKIRVREYVAARIGTELLVPTLLVTHDPDEIGPETILRERFVIKTNHDQGGVLICSDRAAFDWCAAKEMIKKRLKINKYEEFREYQYKKIRPGVIVEEYIDGENGTFAPEVKINCFHGEPKFIQVVLDRFGSCRQVFYYNPDWERITMRGRTAPFDGEVPRPSSLERMLRDAAVLAEPFLFCRVDLLLGAGDRPWFGEITFHPAAGLVRYNPPEIERAFGDMIDLSRFDEARRLQRRMLDHDLRPDAARRGAAD